VKVMVAVVTASVAVPAMIACVGRPTKTILPIFAALVPAGSALPLSVPFPRPFNTVSSLVGAIAVAVAAAHLVLFRRGRVPGLADALWLGFLAWCGATVFWARDPSAAIQELALAVPLILFLVLVSCLRTDRSSLDMLRVAVVVGGAAVGAYGLFLILTGASLPTHGFGQRFSVTTSPHATNPNQLAASLVLPLVLALDIAIRGVIRPRPSSASRIFGGLCFVLIVVGIALSGSRGGALAAVVGVGLTMALSAWWRPETRRSIVQIVGAAYLLVVVLGSLTYVAVRIAPEGAIGDLISSDPLERFLGSTTGSSGRTEIWTTGYIACRTYCAMGVGIGNFPDAYDDTLAYSGLTKNVGLDRPGHNLYLSVAVETGVLGLTLFGLAIVAEWRSLKRTGDMAPVLAAALISLLVADVFEGFLWFKYFWLPFIVIRIAQDVTTPAPATSPSWDLTHAETGAISEPITAHVGLDVGRP
jgi:O-antigen ligase